MYNLEETKKRVLIYRVKHNISNVKFASLINVGHVSIAKLEKNQPISDLILTKINVKLDELEKEEEK